MIVIYVHDKQYLYRLCGDLYTGTTVVFVKFIVEHDIKLETGFYVWYVF